MKKLAYIIPFLIAILLVLPGTTFAYSNAPHNWGIVRAKDEVPPDAGELFNKMLSRNGSVYLGDTKKKDIYLTFDNGYENGYTPKFLDVLKKHKVHATFFITGHYIKANPELVKRMVDEGHIVGNHSWSHPDMTTLGDARIVQELEQVKMAYQELTGRTDMKYFRPARGVFSERTLAIVNREGYENVFWSLAYVDWKVDQQRGWKYAHDNVMELIHPGAVILMHTVSKDNAEAMDAIITDLHKRGYTFRSLDELMLERSGFNPYFYLPK
ncbi:delta-lactam-biosynthetic de-N-acetylase [Bacillus sp. EAC]|uniref:delta-lactam-biosynthetic de-N-acetylase n=1 Tax=Bacillus sp. EAC TaxID=1978338 RepID=UPI000B438A05|nr:delta-lactam-biosynthetic de-N-acetylase [Bacillus sp. EAC]